MRRCSGDRGVAGDGSDDSEEMGRQQRLLWSIRGVLGLGA